MVSKELLDAYEKLNTRRELYRKATQRSNSVSGFGAVILLLSLIPIIPSILKLYFGIDFFYSLAVGTLFGLLLIVIGQRIERRAPLPPKLSIEEEEFLKVVESLKNLDTYQKQRIEFSRIEVVKALSKVEQRIMEPSWGSYPLWRGLTKDVNEKLHLLKRNLKERLLPNITQGKEEDIKKAYSITEKLAAYLINPTVSELEDLNESMSELKPFLKEKVPPIPFFDRHPYMRHLSVLLLNGLCGFLAFYIGVNSLHISTDNAYIAGTTLFGTLTAGYMAIVTRRGWKAV
jgi:cell fate (sporulation/competence/biofilm development) regulator YmcA (YheA/YmcA/DUF963 family)